MIQTIKASGQDVGVVVSDNKVINPLKDKTEYGWYFEQNVYDSDGLIRTLKSSEGSGNIPKVITNSPKRLCGLYDDEKGKHQAGSIWDKDAISPTIDTMQGGHRQPFIVEDKKDMLKTTLCNQLIANGEVKEYDVIKHNYTSQILDGKKRV